MLNMRRIVTNYKALTIKQLQISKQIAGSSHIGKHCNLHQITF